MLTVTTHRAGDIDTLRPVWDAVVAAADRPSFFLSYDWFTCCLQRLEPNADPRVLVVRDGGEAIGVLPLVNGHRTWRLFPLRIVSVIENPDTPIGGFAARAGTAATVAQAIVDHHATLPGWQVFALAKVDPDGPAARALVPLCARRPFVRRTETRSPMVDMHGGWEAYWRAQSQRFKKTVRNVANRIERLGRIEIDDLAASGDPATCAAVFQDVAGRGWKATLATSPTASAAVARFFDALTAVLHQRRQLSLWVLRLDGKPIATEYHVHDGDTVYALRSDFDEQYRDASPGAHLNAVIVRSYFERGVRRYDMGPGDSEYKQRWATGTRTFDTYWLFNRTLYARAVYAFERRAIPPLRRARTWWSGGAPPAEQRGCA